ncbi:TlpA disulfide reductase family protein [Lacibacter sp.]|uniref:peroxiredoxin family protein n=1 Tax=Lacibacter sp. TaxID=1915409 RepID=UPI002B4B1FE9|nr:TlpA disulfide reductase family protein [Lacibacter sp.]HLP38972.1 TlpA disulfide reductase family protein [Lacibacter sp.]
MYKKKQFPYLVDTFKYCYLLIFLLHNAVGFAQVKNNLSVKPAIKTTQLVTGFAHGFEDSTWLYLYEWVTGNTIDSSRILNGQFQLNVPKSFKEKSRLFTIATGSYDNYKSFWMDDTNVIFSAVKGNFKNALLSGSKSQQVHEAYLRSTDSLVIEIDSLRRHFGDTDSLMLLKTNRLVEELKQINIRFIEQNRRSAISAYILRMNCIEWGVPLSRTLYSKLSPENQKTKYGDFVKKYITYHKDIAVGKNYVDFVQMNVEGKPVKLSSFQGKYILLEFWASWCGPCRKENPALVQLYEQYKQKGFEIVAVSLDVNKQQWINAIAKDSLKWPNLSDLKGSDNIPALMYGVYGIPDNFLIDPEGKIIAKNLRGNSLERKLKKLFDQKLTE